MKIPFEEQIIVKQYVKKEVELYNKEFNTDPLYVVYYINTIDSKEDLKFIETLYEFYMKESYNRVGDMRLENILARVVDKSIHDFILHWFKDSLLIIFDYKRFVLDENIDIVGLANIHYHAHYDNDDEKDVYDYIRHFIVSNSIITSNTIDIFFKAIRIFQMAVHLIDINIPDLIINVKSEYLSKEQIREYNPIRIELGFMLDNLITLSLKIHDVKKYDYEYYKYHIIPFRPEDTLTCSDETINCFIDSHKHAHGVIFIPKPDFLSYSLEKMTNIRQELCYKSLTRNYQIYVIYNNFNLDEAIGIIEFTIANKHHIYLHNLYLKEGYSSALNYGWLLDRLLRDLNNRFDSGTMLHYRLQYSEKADTLLRNDFIPISYTLKFTKQDNKISLFSKLFNR